MKWPILDKIHGRENAFGKISIFPVFELLDFLNFSLERSFFVLEYRKTHFLVYIA